MRLDLSMSTQPTDRTPKNEACLRSTPPMDDASQPEDQGDGPTVLETNHDRIISALQMCFNDLARKQEEQADRLQKAVEGLKPQAPTMDTKTKFWNSYMKLADENDNEFHQKYGTDLDTALIFAGLFSAVSSAFITQVQSALQGPHLRKIIAAEILLYVSLFTTLLTALLAVLGKQWVMYYHAAGSKGTVEQRGIERQRKLDGLVRWKFDLVLQTLPLLLQLALLVFSAALSIYLWTVSVPIASVVVTMTCFGFSGYIFLLSTTIFFEDSPFQNPLAPLLSRAFRLPFINGAMNKLRNSLWCLGRSLYSRFRRRPSAILPSVSPTPQPTSAIDKSDLWPAGAFTLPSPEAPAILWVIETSTDPQMVAVAAEMALHPQWALSSNVAGAMARLLEMYRSCFQRSSGDDVFWDVLPGLTSRAISYGKAYCLLRHIAQASKSVYFRVHDTTGHPLSLRRPFDDSDEIAELYDVSRAVAEMVVKLDFKKLNPVRWALYVYPSSSNTNNASNCRDEREERLIRFLDSCSTDNEFQMDQPIFANYLCALNSCFQPMDPKVLAQVNKSHLEHALLIQLLRTLSTPEMINKRLVARVIVTTAHWRMLSSMKRKHPNKNEMTTLHAAVLRFCRLFLRAGDWDVFVAASSLTIVDDYEALYNLHRLDTHSSPTHLADVQDLEWIYMALDHVQQTWNSTDHLGLDSEKTRPIRGLLQMLASAGDIPNKPPLSVLRIILRALSFGEKSSLLAFFVLHRMRTWFVDPEFERVIHGDCVWPDIVKSARSKGIKLCDWRYCEMVLIVADFAQWRPLVHAELAAWLSLYALDWHEWYPLDRFIYITRLIWTPTLPDGIPKFTNKYEECWVLTLAALSKVWQDTNFADPSCLRKCACLARSTVLQVFKTSFSEQKELVSLDFREICCSQLGEALTKASTNARQSISYYRGTESTTLLDPEQVLERLADILEELARKMKTQFSRDAWRVEGGQTIGSSCKSYCYMQ